MESSTLIGRPQSASNTMNASKNCFFIDDDEDDRDFFCAAIKSIDSQMICHFAENGYSAIEKLHDDIAFTPDFIFIDMNMPIMDGGECLRAIRSIPRLCNVPVYMYSTSASPKTVSDAIADGATQFLVKPSTMNGLAELLIPIIGATI